MTYDDPIALVDEGWNQEPKLSNGSLELIDLLLGMESGVVWARPQIFDRYMPDLQCSVAEPVRPLSGRPAIRTG
jgi:hypothetical protein